MGTQGLVKHLPLHTGAALADLVCAISQSDKPNSKASAPVMAVRALNPGNLGEEDSCCTLLYCFPTREKYVESGTAPERLAQTMFGTWLVPVSQEWEPSDALNMGRVPLPFALWFARPVLGTSPLRPAVAAELGQVWEHGFCFHLH